MMPPNAPFVNPRRVSPADHTCDPLVCGIHFGDCPDCWDVVDIPTPTRGAAPDHILDTLAARASDWLRESVEDVHASLRPGEALPDMLADVRHRSAGKVLLGLVRRLLEGPARETLKENVRETMSEELPGVLAALGLLHDDAAIGTDRGDC